MLAATALELATRFASLRCIARCLRVIGKTLTNHRENFFQVLKFRKRRKTSSNSSPDISGQPFETIPVRRTSTSVVLVNLNLPPT